MQGYISTREAAEAAGITLHGLRLWFQRYPGLGRKVAGRWHVNARLFAQILAGEAPNSGKGGHHGENTNQARTAHG